jgi:GABA(A) receptor-associated protein
MTFKEKFSFQSRKEESTKVMTKYPDKVPVICEKLNSYDPDINKIKFLIPIEVTLAYFMYLIKKRHILNKNEGIFILINGVIPPCSFCFYQLYELFKQEDGFLYINYSIENVFGS